MPDNSEWIDLGSIGIEFYWSFVAFWFVDQQPNSEICRMQFGCDFNELGEALWITKKKTKEIKRVITRETNYGHLDK